MDASTALRSAGSVLQRPAGILPAYFLTPAVPAVARAISFLGLAVGYLYLETTGRLARFRAEFAASDLESPPSAEANPEAFGKWVEEAMALVEPLVTPTTVAILAVTLLASVLVSVVLLAVVTAAQLSASHARLRSERGVTAALRGGRRHWVSILGLQLLEIFLLVVAFGGIAVGVGVATVALPVVGILSLLVAVPFAIGLFVVIRVVFIFAAVAVVVDDASVGESIRRAVEFASDEALSAAAYVLIALAGFLLVGSLGAVFATQNGGALVGVIGFVLLSPGLDLVKTAFYGDYRGRIDPPSPPETPTSERLQAGLRRGVDELLAFVREHPVLHAVSLGVAVVGFAAGWVAIEPFLGLGSTSIAERLADHNPILATVEFGANNWSVAVSTAFAGLVLAVPAAGALFFNGFVLGLIARTEEALPELLAFVVPHGILEIPAFVVAGALGFSLGGAGWRTLRGRTSVDGLADAVERAFWVAVGLAVLLGIAAVIEGFVSPYYYRPFL